MIPMMNLTTINGKNVLLFGCTGVLGKAHVSILSSLGCNLLIADRKGSGIERVAEEFQVDYVYADASSETDMINLAQRTTKIFGELDAAIYNVAITSEGLAKGGSPKSYEFTSYPLHLWEMTININLTGAFLFAREVGKQLVSQRSGSLIFISSIYGTLAPDHRIYNNERISTFPGYSASKSGLIGLMRWLSTLWAPYNIRVNAVSPGGIYNNHSTSFVEKYTHRVPMERMGTNTDITGILSYLISDSSSYTTGQNIHIDGGLSAW